MKYINQNAAAANSSAARDVAFHLHPYTNPALLKSKGPLVITRGDGVRIYDDQGNAYIEGLAGLGCVSLGFSEDRLVDAAARQMKRLPFYHCFSGRAPDVTIDLAEKLVAMAPAPMAKVFFACSGSEANDTAVKIVWYVNRSLGRPERRKIITLKNAYHGVTVATASLTGLPRNHGGFGLPLEDFLHTDCPHHYRFGLTDETEEDFASRCVGNLKALIEAEGPETIAAFFAEPIIGAGGIIPPPRTYFDKVQAVLRRHDILFLADEVFTGFARSGRMFASEIYDLKPDMITLGKALTSAYMPLSALLVSKPLVEALEAESDRIGVFGHGFTYGGHPVSCAVGLETLRIYEEEDILSRVARVAPVLQDGLRSLADHPLVGEVRGLGLLGAVELVRDKQTKALFADQMRVGHFVVERALSYGVITRLTANALAFFPPLVIEKPEIEEMVTGVRRALDDTLEMVRTHGLG